MPDDPSPPVACTLQPGDYKERLKWIGDVNARFLRGRSRAGLTLALTYATRGRDLVAEMVRREQECCAFLTFTTSETSDAITVTITAPAEVAETADMVFAPFISGDAGCGCSGRAC